MQTVFCIYLNDCLVHVVCSVIYVMKLLSNIYMFLHCELNPCPHVYVVYMYLNCNVHIDMPTKRSNAQHLVEY